MSFKAAFSSAVLLVWIKLTVNLEFGVRLLLVRQVKRPNNVDQSINQSINQSDIINVAKIT